jgi:DNA-binding transcriptional ArsR family regulator
MPKAHPDALPEALLEPIADRFRVLGDATRLAILRALLDGHELNVGDLVDRLGASQANVSKHLGILHRAGIVARRPEGTAAYYSIVDPTLVSLCSLVCDRLRSQVAGTAEAYGL